MEIYTYLPIVKILTYATGHRDIESNNKADELAKSGT